MGSQDLPHRKARKTHFEPLEVRQVFSADPLAGALGTTIEHHAFEEPPLELHSEPVLEHHSQDRSVELHDAINLDEGPSLVHHVERAADFWIDSSLETDVDVLFDRIEQTLSSAHNLTGAVQARADYGFTGLGQTIVVIDSGIAWNHYALGGGYGANYRVVGGWDFAENDADPFDDGNAGKHGTHVAGIIGANAGTSADSGVAPGVDLVGLRVFDDAGNGFFSWVESALRWVHTNKDAFENPITAVNLSLGTSWNSASIPSWAMLEEEFAQLEADGIFISVSAGNSFTTYNAKGLSYPAASPYVVPVMSVDDNGNMSSFSQRHERAIGAPGRSIRSTLPDYAGNKNGITDDWGNLSGTSMAAPYVAGASAIIRQAMEFVGRTGIDQWDIYDHMMATADLFYDSATSTTYKRLDLKTAIDALMPTDDYGSTSATAYGLGSLTGNRSIAGLIGTTSDKDFFTFTASANGKVTLSADATHQLSPLLSVTGSTATFANGVWTFDVVAGQSYTIGIETTVGAGIGYYDLDLGFEATPDPVVAVKSIAHNGAVYTLDSSGWLSYNGIKVWANTYDFAFSPVDGTMYWQSTTGLFQHRNASGQWKSLDSDTIKFEIAADGRAYTLGADTWLCINGERVWFNTKDFDIAPDQTLYWQSTSGLLQQRMLNGVWRNVDLAANRFAVRNNGVLYVLGNDNVVDINGIAVWATTQDFVLTGNQDLYWLSTYGLLQRLPNGGSWQNVDTGVTKFAVRQDGVVFTLSGDGRVRENGVEKWTGVSDLRNDSNGRLVVDRTSAVDVTVAGRFVLGGGNQVAASSMMGQNSVGTGSLSSLVGVDSANRLSFGNAILTARSVLSVDSAPQATAAHQHRAHASSTDTDAALLSVISSRLDAVGDALELLWDVDAEDEPALEERLASDLATFASREVNPRLDEAAESLFEQLGL